MLTMQTFHNRLFSSRSTDNVYLRCLVRLTRARLVQMAVLKGAPSWDQWSSETA